MTKLKELVAIRSGYTFRTAIDSFSDGDTEVIQSKDLGDYFDFFLRPKIDFPGDDNHLLQPGEILFSARGFAKAVVFRDATSRAVASSSLFVLHPKSQNIDASFLAMYLSSIEGIKSVMKLSSGSSVKTITKEDLGSIEIPEVPPDKQRALGGATQAIDDYVSMLREKTMELNNIRSAIIKKTIKGASK
jgi:restriction endonuclease S subunit